MNQVEAAKLTVDSQNGSANTYSGSTFNSGNTPTSVRQHLTLTIIYHPQHSRMGDRALLDPQQPTRVSRHETLFSSHAERAERPLSDPFLSRQPLVISPAMAGAVRLAPGHPKTRGQVNGRPIDSETWLGAHELSEGVVITLAERVALLLHRTTDEVGASELFGLVGKSQRIRSVRACIQKAAASNVPVLLRGETGTGKELVAQAIAAASQRGRPYIAVNMGAITPEMATAEFFGVQRKSATGVDAREGLFAAAQGGTLFLDEVGLAHVQVLNTLLRALDSGEIQRVGAKGSERLQAPVRLISATDADLELAIDQGRFSQAILQRLGSYPIVLPAMRERREDLGLLLTYFLKTELENLGHAELLDYEPASLGWLRTPLIARLAQYPFPGNVRELRNLAQSLAIHSCTLPEARLPEDWVRRLENAAGAARASSAPEIGAPTGERSPSQPALSAIRSTLPPDAPFEVQSLPQPRPSPGLTDEQFRALAYQCLYSKSAMAHQLGWDRRQVDKRWNAIGMRSVKDISVPQFKEAVTRYGWDWERLAQALGVSRKSLRDRFGAGPTEEFP